MTQPRKANLKASIASASSQGLARVASAVPIKPSEPPKIPPPPVYPLMTLTDDFSGDASTVDKILDLSSFPFAEEQVIAYQSELGLFPETGPAELLRDDGYLQAHVDAVKATVAAIIPDPDFDGYAIIDYEGWSLLWHRTEEVYQQQWVAAWDEVDPEQVAAWRAEGDQTYWNYIAGSYNAVAREFYLATIEQCRATRPKAKWGFFQRVFKNIMTDGTLADDAQGDNEDIAWLFEASDFICPSLLTPFETVADETKAELSPAQQRFSERKKIVQDAIDEAMEHAAKFDIPVLPLLWVRHNGASFGNYQNFLSALTIRATLEALYDSFANGVFLWYSISGESDATSFVDHLQNVFVPQLEDVWSELFDYDPDDDDKPIEPVKIPVDGGYITPHEKHLVFSSEKKEVQGRMPWDSIDEARGYVKP